MKVAVVSPARRATTETFVRAHVERLPAKVGGTVHLHGDELPLWQDGERTLPPRALHLAGRLVEAALGKDRRDATRFLARQLPNRLRERPLARHLRRIGVDVVLAEFGPTGVAMLPVARRAGVPLVVHFHGLDAYDRHELEAYGAAYRSLLAEVPAVVAVSRDMVEQLVSLGADPSRVHLNPYGIDTDRFQPADVAGSGPNLLAVGRFVEKKAPHLTLLAFARTASSHPDATLTMVGEGPLRDACRTLAEALGVGDRVRFPGAVPHERVRALMGEARAFVQHSLRPPSGDSEGNPVAVREAMASGLPVVATRHAGIEDSVVQGETGLLVEEQDWESMARHMGRLLDDPSLASEMGRAGRERAVEAFAMDAAISGLAAVLEAAVRDGPPADGEHGLPESPPGVTPL